VNERRVAAELRFAGGRAAPRLEGYAAVFDKVSQDLGGFTEIVRPGAFTRSLREGADVLALVHHKPEMVLGRRSAGTLRLSEDAHGLAFDVALPDTTAARDLAVSVERGDIRGASFAFTVPKNGDHWFYENGRAMRELLDVNLHDVTVTAAPAYADTEVARRALVMLGGWRLRNARRYLETLDRWD
jgi:HK97 family phage prohead protease